MDDGSVHGSNKEEKSDDSPGLFRVMSLEKQTVQRSGEKGRSYTLDLCSLFGFMS